MIGFFLFLISLPKINAFIEYELKTNETSVQLFYSTIILVPQMHVQILPYY